MAGLFTLDDEALGVLNEDPLGGFGTGFIVASLSSSGSVVGFLGFGGSVSGSTTSTGSLSGAVGYLGAAAGSVSTDGSAAGSPALSGAVSGSAVSAGTVTGEEGNTDTISGQSVGSGSVTGIIDCTGFCTGESVSTGSVTGTVPAPPDPNPDPEPETEAGGVAMARWYVKPPKRRHPSGTVTGSALSQGRAFGRCGYAGSASGSTSTRPIVAGQRSIQIPIEPRIRDHSLERRRLEDEALILELL